MPRCTIDTAGGNQGPVPVTQNKSNIKRLLHDNFGCVKFDKVVKSMYLFLGICVCILACVLSSCSATFGAQLCTNMPRQLKLLAEEPGLPGKLAAAFAKEEKLKTVGRSFYFCFFVNQTLPTLRLASTLSVPTARVSLARALPP